MKKILYALLLGAALMTPERKLDVAKLIPVELVYLGYENGTVLLETDTGEQGRGIGIAAALKDLEESAPGVIYLDTAEHLLVNPAAEMLLPDLAPYLKKDVGVCLAASNVDLKQAAAYLAVHKSGVKLGELKIETAIPEMVTNGKSFLIKN